MIILTALQNFHTDTDAGDITALYVQNKAKYGGDQRLASISTVYNELQKTHPEAINTLMQNWRFEVPWGYEQASQVSCSFVPRQLTQIVQQRNGSHQSTPTVPPGLAPSLHLRQILHPRLHLRYPPPRLSAPHNRTREGAEPRPSDLRETLAEPR